MAKIIDLQLNREGIYVPKGEIKVGKVYTNKKNNVNKKLRQNPMYPRYVQKRKVENIRLSKEAEALFGGIGVGLDFIEHVQDVMDRVYRIYR